MAARRAHNPEVGGSSPPPATETDDLKESSVFSCFSLSRCPPASAWPGFVLYAAFGLAETVAFCCRFLVPAASELRSVYRKYRFPVAAWLRNAGEASGLRRPEAAVRAASCAAGISADAMESCRNARPARFRAPQATRPMLRSLVGMLGPRGFVRRKHPGLFAGNCSPCGAEEPQHGRFPDGLSSRLAETLAYRKGPDSCRGLFSWALFTGCADQ